MRVIRHTLCVDVLVGVNGVKRHVESQHWVVTLFPVLHEIDDGELVLKLGLLFQNIQTALVLSTLHFVFAVVVLRHVKCRVTFSEERFAVAFLSEVDQAGRLFLELLVKFLDLNEVCLSLVYLAHLVVELVLHFFGAWCIALGFLAHFKELPV